MFLHVFFAVFVSALSFFIPVMPFSFHQESPAAPNEAAYAELPSVATPPVPAATSTAGVDVPILVYHIVRPSYLGDDAAVRAIALTPGTFDAELLHLQSAGYHVVSFRNLEAYFANSTPLPTKPIILSFDDGWRDQFVYAFPLLEKHRDTATFFIFTNAIGHRGFVTWSDLHALIAAGMTVGDHSRSHPFLTKITDPGKLRDEIVGSKQILEQGLGVPITEFAYPFGQYNPAVISLLKQADFKSARGDYWFGNFQPVDRLYTLSALNAPTTTAAFDARFP
ncbi:MAG: polysaccharide deacetylase family protein [Patescibacteria group bacterium]|nr:polysaccharide deacetylase family protein [Patescibacteria group bacterium]